MQIAFGGAVVGLIVLANCADLYRGLRPVVYALLALGGFLLCGAGVAALGYAWFSYLGLNAYTTRIDAWLIIVAGGLTVGAGLLGLVVLIRRVRLRISRLLAIRPDSCVHAAALSLAAYAVCFSMLQALVWSRPHVVMPVTPPDLLVSAVLMLAMAASGVGLLVRRNVRETLARLGLRRPNWNHLALVIVAIGAFLAVDAGVGRLWETLSPASFERTQKVAASLFAAVLTPAGALAVGLTAGIGEEILFRGALQPRLGMVLTSMLFALAHFQYSFSLGMLEVLGLGLALGCLRRRVGTVPCVLVHAGYNVASVVMLMSG